jgi:transmembrane sensor
MISITKEKSMTGNRGYPKHINQEHIEEAWEKLELIIEDNNIKSSKLRSYVSSSYSIAAAISILLISVIVSIMVLRNSSVIHRTNYGETATITLPDNSVVTLNGNSKLTYNENWIEQEDREVWLEGEAYFSVVHTDSNQKFYVRTKDNLTVEVLGTEFTVTKRKTRTRVVLNSGKIMLAIDNDKGVEKISMRPGDLVTYKDTAKTILKMVVNPELYSSWKDNKLLFHETELQEVIQIMEETYGVHVKVNDPKLLDKKISGSAPNGNLRLLINGLSEAFNLEITQSGKSVSVSSR